MERSIQEVARAAGTTSRTLRHYDRVGILPPSRIGSNGYRYYDERALVRLQRVLLLRDLGLGLDAIAEVLASQDAQAGSGEAPEHAEARILATHLELLQRERGRITEQIGAVERTIAALRQPGTDAPRTHTERDLMSENMFAGFDHSEYREEVAERWGRDAAERSSAWWDGLDESERASWMGRVAELNRDWTAAAARGIDPASPEAQQLAARHVAWLRSVPGTPANETAGDLAGYVTGLAEMYVLDERFAANYGGQPGATLVRDALLSYVATELGGSR